MSQALYPDIVLRLENISKSFPGVLALDRVCLNVKRGEVHALMGENGAGKSTLMKILAGLYLPDSGKIILQGREVLINNPKLALDLGISMIHQELNHVSEMTVSENIFLGKEPCYKFLNTVDTGLQRKMTVNLFTEAGIAIDPDAIMGDLSVAQMQMVEIIKAVSCKSSVIIMDEPTSAITDKEVDKLFEMIRGLKSKGIAIIYISHKMDEIFRIADTITVLRDGQYIATSPANQLDDNSLIKLMVGREITEIFPSLKSGLGNVLLQVEGLTREGEFQDISFNLREGEILGLSGLMGAGRTEVGETIFGLHLPDSGTIKINGKLVRHKSPSDAIKNKLAFISEDRKLKGLNLVASIRQNISFLILTKFCRFGQIIKENEESVFVDLEIRKFGIKTAGHDTLVGNLSGGNQQKVVLSKWLATNPDIIILDEPTRGIDVGSKAEIYCLINELAQQGKAILLISSELPEIIGLCHRTLVLHEGKITAEFQREEFSQEKIMEAAMGYISKS
jgi:inositol transport system ATP-binding protein